MHESGAVENRVPVSTDSTETTSAWQPGSLPPTPSEAATPSFTPPQDSGFGAADALCDQFEAAWRAGQRPSLEGFLARASMASRSRLLLELLVLELCYRRAAGEAPRAEEYLERFPQDGEAVRRAFAEAETPPWAPRQEVHGVPPVLGEYEILAQLGSGGMGVVYKARHRRLKRFLS